MKSRPRPRARAQPNVNGIMLHPDCFPQSASLRKVSFELQNVEYRISNIKVLQFCGSNFFVRYWIFEIRYSKFPFRLRSSPFEGPTTVKSPILPEDESIPHYCAFSHSCLTRRPIRVRIPDTTLASTSSCRRMEIAFGRCTWTLTAFALLRAKTNSPYCCYIPPCYCNI